MKRIICLLLVLSLFLSISAVSLAECVYTPSKYENIFVSNDGTRAEETEWIYRRWNGLVQMRLWSITYGYWLTDWITIGYYDP